jgi:hypothetical protein
LLAGPPLMGSTDPSAHQQAPSTMARLYGRGAQCCWGKVTNTCGMQTSNQSNEAAVAPRPMTTTSTPKMPRPISRTKQPRQEEREERRQQKAGGSKAPLPQGTSCTPSMAIAPSIVCSFPPISNPLTYLHRKTTQDRNHEDAALKSPPRSKQTA